MTPSDGKPWKERIKFYSASNSCGWHFGYRAKGYVGTLQYPETWRVSVSTNHSSSSTFLMDPVYIKLVILSNLIGSVDLFPGTLQTLWNIICNHWYTSSSRKAEVAIPTAGVMEEGNYNSAVGMCSQGSSCLKGQSWSVTVVQQQVTKEAIKRIHLVSNYCIQFCSVLKIWSGKHCL